MPMRPRVIFDDEQIEFVQPNLHIQSRKHRMVEQQMRELLATATRFKMELDKLEAAAKNAKIENRVYMATAASARTHYKDGKIGDFSA